jgi:para-nitrobenzyl esterase
LNEPQIQKQSIIMIRHPFLWLLLASLFQPVTFTFAAEKTGPVVVANGEEMLGAWAGGTKQVATFKSIPFAAPPVGHLRWRAPRPHLPRQGRQTATSFGPGCMQGPGGVDWYVGVAAAFGHGPEAVGRPNGLSEDCLYLNVWSPDPVSDAGLPVMVFVHGGSNAGGWSYEPNYIGENLAARGVVVVTIAYRVGPFGFFSHPALNKAQGEPIANFGLLDIRAGFQWVNSHIRSFGGDPENITAFGESSGAFNLVDLLLVDMAGGRIGDSLFRRLLSQSIGGPSTIRKTLAEEQATGEFLAQQLGLGPEVTADRLRQVPAGELIRAVANLPDSHYFSAVIDGNTVPRHPLETLRSARAAGVDLIAGTNADEWYMYISDDVTQKDVQDWVAENAPEHQAAVLAAVADEPDVRKALDRLRTAQAMLCPSRFLAARINQAGGHAWVYYFSRQRVGNGGDRLRVYHGTELPYVFDRHDNWLPLEEADRILTDAVLDYWVRFATTGDPNMAGRPAWPVHTQQEPAVMELGDQIGEMKTFSTGLCQLLGPGQEPAR